MEELVLFESMCGFDKNWKYHVAFSVYMDSMQGNFLSSLNLTCAVWAEN